MTDFDPTHVPLGAEHEAYYLYPLPLAGPSKGNKAQPENRADAEPQTDVQGEQEPAADIIQPNEFDDGDEPEAGWQPRRFADGQRWYPHFSRRRRMVVLGVALLGAGGLLAGEILSNGSGSAGAAPLPAASASAQPGSSAPQSPAATASHAPTAMPLPVFSPTAAPQVEFNPKTDLCGVNTPPPINDNVVDLLTGEAGVTVYDDSCTTQGLPAGTLVDRKWSYRDTSGVGVGLVEMRIDSDVADMQATRFIALGPSGNQSMQMTGPGNFEQNASVSQQNEQVVQTGQQRFNATVNGQTMIIGSENGLTLRFTASGSDPNGEPLSTATTDQNWTILAGIASAIGLQPCAETALANPHCATDGVFSDVGNKNNPYMNWQAVQTFVRAAVEAAAPQGVS